MTDEQDAMIEKARDILRKYGVDIALPWEGDLDDREQERFEGLKEAVGYVKGECSVLGFNAVNAYRGSGETDLRSVRYGVQEAILTGKLPSFDDDDED